MSMRWSTGIIRTLTVGCAVGLLFVAPPATRAQDAAIAVGVPDAVSILNSGLDPGVVEEVTAETDPATCKDPGGCYTVKLAVKNKQQTIVAAEMEYYPSSCQEVSTGEWSGIKSPTHGNYGNTTITGTLSNGDCAGITFTFGALYYTADKVTEKKVKDELKASWKTKDYPSVCGTCKVEVTAHIKIAD
jgi:hypothetical protein